MKCDKKFAASSSWLETLRFLTFTCSSKYLYWNFSRPSQIHLILRNDVQVSGHKVTNKPIPELTQTSSGIAHSATFTFYQEISVINFLPRSTLHFMSLSLSIRRSNLYFHSLSKYHYIALALHWRHSNFCTFAAA